MEDPCQNCLFRVVRDMWSKAIDHAAKVSIRTLYNIRGCHEWFQQEEYCNNCSMHQVLLENSKLLGISIFPHTCNRREMQ